MILKAKDTYGYMPVPTSREYGISPVDGKENLKVWPKGEGTFCIAKGEKYNVEKQHPFFESGDQVSRSKKVSDDNSPSPDKGNRPSG